MSRAGPRIERISNDAYYTPDDAARKCVALLNIDPGHAVLEPSSGGGAFVRAVQRQQPNCTVFTCDTDSNAARGWEHYAVRFQDINPAPHLFDWVLGNPPYSEAEEHVRHALSMARDVAFLLRIGFLACERRRVLWRETPLRSVHVLTNRPSFTKNGKTDGAEYAFFHWSHSPPRHGCVAPFIGWI